MTALQTSPRTAMAQLDMCSVNAHPASISFRAGMARTNSGNLGALTGLVQELGNKNPTERAACISTFIQSQSSDYPKMKSLLSLDVAAARDLEISPNSEHLKAEDYIWLLDNLKTLEPTSSVIGTILGFRQTDIEQLTA